ncbi:hypothetical protein EDD16DRAFT_1531331 [Pisolithus croceorrhizus]|nr:hypothetical protein EDD16DRAFT_1531331 [Pisolithus croceorrhizus]KAI6159540.1 hypothetical protein EDD17DRAFT_893854 [Pisolithus thermaeus]
MKAPLSIRVCPARRMQLLRRLSPALFQQSFSSLSHHVAAALVADHHPPGELGRLVREYEQCSATVLRCQLPIEHIPCPARKVDTSSPESGSVLIVHALDCGQAGVKKTIGSGFAIRPRPGSSDEDTMVLTCAHTLEEIAQIASSHSKSNGNKDVYSRSGSWVISEVDGQFAMEPLRSVLSAVRHADILLLSAGRLPLRTLPVSPFPATVGSTVYAHFVSAERPESDHPWFPWVGGTWRTWMPCTVTGYKDRRGRVAQTGTYDELTQMMFYPAPPPGSSGGPIVNECGTVVGVTLGSMRDYGQSSHQGWGVPAQDIYEMFTLLES